jgi:hypothetical protein
VYGLPSVKSYKENIKKQERKLTASFYKNGKPTRVKLFIFQKLDELLHSAKCSLYTLDKSLNGMRTCKDMMKTKITVNIERL